MNRSDLIQVVVNHALAHHSNGKSYGGGLWLAVLCPKYHEHDKYNHAQLNTEGGFINCHGVHGVMKLEEVCDLWGIAHDLERGVYTPPQRREPPPKKAVYYDTAWENALQSGTSPRVLALQNWLASRGINQTTACIGQLGYTGEDYNIVDEGGKVCKWAWHKLSIPWVVEGRVVAVKLRKLPTDKPDALKYVSLPNSDFSGLYNMTWGDTVARMGWEGEPVNLNIRVLFETELDALAASALCGWYSLGIACPANQMNPYKAGLLAGYEVGLALDRDEAGAKTLEKVSGFLPDIAPLYPLDGCKDFGAGLPALPEWLEPLLYQRWTLEGHKPLEEHFMWQNEAYSALEQDLEEIFNAR